MSDIDKAIEASRPEFERLAAAEDMSTARGGGGYGSSLTRQRWHGWCARIRSEDSTLNEIGYYRTDTQFMSLNMSDTQLTPVADCVVEWGESVEETIAIACRGALRAENQELPG